MPFWVTEILWRIRDKIDVVIFFLFYLLGSWGANHNNFWASDIGAVVTMFLYLMNRRGD